MFEVIPVSAFTDNYIWLITDPRSRHTAIVDPGDAAPVLEALDEHSLQPCAILITHHHGDHCGGVPGLLREHAVPVFGPATENIPGRTHAVRGGDQVEIRDLAMRFRVMDIPGHTAGHVAYHGHGMAFVGDTLFLSGCGRLFEGTAAQMHQSLARIQALPGDTQIYCGHEYTLANLRFARAVEPDNARVAEREAECRGRREQGLPTVPAALELERHTNPFLRVAEPAVRRAAAGRAGRRITDDIDAFAVVRRWKDEF